ncbi:lipoprotein [Spiroplasma endosymbiont of Sarcophaga variegata]|uniref:lipoprotein n=1 Tax=Spiroplasma endosymbiont of Sarcophaga variegata TaxID=3066304 RepID=UPI003AF49577
MKRLLSIIGAISLIGTSTTSLVACKDKTHEYTPEELAKLKAENKINTKDQNIKDNLEWMAPQEKPFNKVGNNKYYYIVWRGKKTDKWKLIKYKDLGLISITLIDKTNNNSELHRVSNDLQTIADKEYSSWCTNFGFNNKDDGTHFKSVYRWNLDTAEPNLIVDDKGNVKVKGE